MRAKVEVGLVLRAVLAAGAKRAERHALGLREAAHDGELHVLVDAAREAVVRACTRAHGYRCERRRACSAAQRTTL